jgi:predicted DNA-binding transcriptional regulator YafY
MHLATRPPLRRLLHLDRAIRAGGYPNAVALAAELEVAVRTVYRDLDLLRDGWGAPLEFCRRQNGFYYRDPDWPLPTLRLTADEVAALFLAERALHAHEGTPYGAALASLLGKLTAALPGEVSLNLGRLGEGYSFRHHGQQPGDVKCFRGLSRAVQEGRQLELVYWSASRGEACRRVVDPYHLAELEGDW